MVGLVDAVADTDPVAVIVGAPTSMQVGDRHRGVLAFRSRVRGRAAHWTAVALDTAGLPDGWDHWLLVRRQTEPSEGKTVRELAFYRCTAPARTPLRELVRVAGARWAIEECFQTAKNEAGLDQYQVRSWRAWYAHITLAMLAAAAYLAATRAREAEKGGSPGDERGLIPLSGNEIRRLLAALVPAASRVSTISWSIWRRRRQHQARASHYRRRGERLPT